jgi:hypothetical protein
MKLSEFSRRARASRMEKKAKFDAAFQRALRDLDLPRAASASAPPRPHTFIRSESPRPILTLFGNPETSELSQAGK